MSFTIKGMERLLKLSQANVGIWGVKLRADGVAADDSEIRAGRAIARELAGKIDVREVNKFLW